jgi:uncharacterized membrane protein
LNGGRSVGRSGSVGAVFALSAAVLRSTMGMAQALAMPRAESEVVGAVRIAVGGTVLLAIAAARGALKAGALGVMLLGERSTFSAAVGACSVLCGTAVLMMSLGTCRHETG